VLHTIRADIADRDRWNVSGAVSVENSKTPTVDAVKALIAAGSAKPSDSIRVQWQGVPFTASVGSIAAYRPSDAAKAAGRSGATSIPSHFGHIG
jgi:hypothetical protein